MRWLLLPLLFLLTACPIVPPMHSSDYDVAFARAYGRGRSAAEWERPPRDLSVEQLYALQRHGRLAFHPWRSVAAAFACRGAAAVPFLKTRIRERTFGSLVEVFRWMRLMNTYDVAGDADLIARLRGAYAAMPGTLRRAYAGDLAFVTGELDPDAATELRGRHCA